MPVYDICEGVQGQSRKSHILDLHHSQVCHGEISRSTSDSCVVIETTYSASLNGKQAQHRVIRKRDAKRSGSVHKDGRKLLALPDSLSFTRAGSVSLMICKSAKVLRLKQRLSAGTEKSRCKRYTNTGLHKLEHAQGGWAHGHSSRHLLEASHIRPIMNQHVMNRGCLTRNSACTGITRHKCSGSIHLGHVCKVQGMHKSTSVRI